VPILVRIIVHATWEKSRQDFHSVAKLVFVEKIGLSSKVFLHTIQQMELQKFQIMFPV
ncbi:hypothetical protein MTO96_045748, partial [Rhipicephalus appendiculatus]